MCIRDRSYVAFCKQRKQKKVKSKKNNDTLIIIVTDTNNMVITSLTDIKIFTVSHSLLVSTPEFPLPGTPNTEWNLNPGSSDYNYVLDT